MIEVKVGDTIVITSAPSWKLTDRVVLTIDQRTDFTSKLYCRGKYTRYYKDGRTCEGLGYIYLDTLSKCDVQI